MVLKNYYEFLRHLCSYPTQLAPSTSLVKDLNNANLAGIYYPVGGGSTYLQPDMRSRIPKSALDILIGTGDTAPTYNDYSLENAGSLASVSTNISFDVISENNVIKFRTLITKSVNNNTQDTVTIKEIGVYKRVYTTSEASSQNILISREILSEPIVIEPNGEATFVFYFDEQ